MYSEQQIKELLSFTTDFLQLNKVISYTNIELLRDVLRFHEYRYYVQSNPLISDFEYDTLYKKLEKIETENSALITTDSPTQRVGVGLIKDFAKVQHLVPMLSLENSYNANDLKEWDKKCREITGLEVIEYTVEPKFDGASISLVYENNILVKGITRGDGVVGDDISPNIKQIRSVPLKAMFSKYNIQQIEIRGEVLINKNNFKKYNDKLIIEGAPPLANPRNAAAGSLRIKDTAEVAKRNLEAFLYHVSFITTIKELQKNEIPKTHSNMIEMLWQLGFKSPKNELKFFIGIDEVVEHINNFELKRDELPFEIDGMVIKVNSLPLQDILGMTSHHPRWAMAFKFKARQATTTLIGVEYQVGRTGAITPVAKLKPVQIGGVTVSSISIHNQDYIIEKDLKIGDTILIERSGDVIPQIVKSFTELRKGEERCITFPTKCPVCNQQLFKLDEEAVWRCININCEAQVVGKIIHFVSKDAMDIRSLGEANVVKFYEQGFLKDIPSIYNLPFEKIKETEGFGEKSIKNLQESIEASKTQSLNRIIFGLGIRFVGETTAKTLANAVESLNDFKHFSLNQLLQLEDVGIKVATSIIDFFSNNDNIILINKLEAVGVQLKNETKEKITNGNLIGQTFLFTGTLTQMKRNEAEDLVEKNGGKILSGVSSKLNYLIVGEDAGSKQEKAKKINTIKIITEADFLKLIKTN